MNQTMTLPNVLTLEEATDYLLLPREAIGCLDSRTILLQQAGALAEDETLPDLRATIYAARDRFETVTG